MADLLRYTLAVEVFHLHDGFHLSRQRRSIINRHDEATAFYALIARDALGRDHRDSGAHRLQQHQRLHLAATGQHQCVTVIEQPADSLFVYPAISRHVFQLLLLHHLPAFLAVGVQSGNMQLNVAAFVAELPIGVKQHVVTFQMIEVCQATEPEWTPATSWSRLVGKEIGIDGIRNILPPIILPIITRHALHQLFGYRQHHSSLFVCLLQQGHLPGMVRGYAKLPFQQHQRQVFRHHVRNLVLLSYLHCRIACPLATMSMNDVGLSVAAHIVFKHRLNNGNPPTYIRADSSRQSALKRL